MPASSSRIDRPAVAAAIDRVRAEVRRCSRARGAARADRATPRASRVARRAARSASIGIAAAVARSARQRMPPASARGNSRRARCRRSVMRPVGRRCSSASRTGPMYDSALPSAPPRSPERPMHERRDCASSRASGRGAQPQRETRRPPARAPRRAGPSAPAAAGSHRTRLRPRYRISMRRASCGARPRRSRCFPGDTQFHRPLAVRSALQSRDRPEQSEDRPAACGGRARRTTRANRRAA